MDGVEELSSGLSSTVSRDSCGVIHIYPVGQVGVPRYNWSLNRRRDVCRSLRVKPKAVRPARGTEGLGTSNVFAPFYSVYGPY